MRCPLMRCYRHRLSGTVHPFIDLESNPSGALQVVQQAIGPAQVPVVDVEFDVNIADFAIQPINLRL